jgi:DNA-binding CsgD family transcriptional regulator
LDHFADDFQAHQNLLALVVGRPQKLRRIMTGAQRETIHSLWDQVADFPASQTDEALVGLMDGICKLINAGEANWFGALRLVPASEDDVLLGWRPRAIRYLHPSPAHEEAYRNTLSLMKGSRMNSSYRLAVRDAGTFRSYRIRQELPAEWFESDYYKTFLASRGYHDSCYVAFPLHEDCESHFAFHRTGSRKNFTAREEAIAAYALRGLKWFHRQLIVSHGVMFAEGPLTAVQRRIVHLLLAGSSEKEIAHELGKSPHTAHKHITEIFRKYGVNSRASLMALWLGQKA